MATILKGVQKYPNIFQAGKIGGLEIKNRTVMAAMGCSAAPGGYVNDMVINHYVERAKGGVGLVIVEVTCVDGPLGLNTANMLRIDHDHYIPGMTKLAKAIHESGAKCLLQISHTGRGARRGATGMQPVGPSAVAMPLFYTIGVENETPRELTVKEIQNIEDKYAQAAMRAKRAGFDGVEIHSTGYYLGEQFLSTQSNRRTDEYGGTPEKRCLFHTNVYEKTRELCGHEFVIAIKATVLEGEYITLQEGIYYCTRFAQAGYDAIEVMAGATKVAPDMGDMPSTTGSENSMVGLCGAVKNAVLQSVPGTKVQFIGGGRCYDPSSMQSALSSGQLDFVFLGKGIFADPHIINRIMEDKPDEIRPCIGCSLCMTIQLDTGEPGRCSGNAVEGRGDNSYELAPIERTKNVIVIGAGIAGCEAARVAAKRGHNVTLYEASDGIGGQLIDAFSPLHKDYLKRMLPYMKKQLDINGVKVVLGKRLSSQEVLDLNPDAVICATGVKPAKLPIKGIDNKCVVTAKDVLRGRVTPGEKVVIVGGGVIGCETAEKLAAEKKQVTIVELLDKLAGRMLFGNRCVLLAHLEGYGVKVYTQSLCSEVKDGSVIVRQNDGKEIEIPCDTVIISVGDQPAHELYDELLDKIPEVFNAGDSYIPDSFSESVAAGYYAGSMV